MEKLQPEKLVEILHKKGIHVTLEQAKQILTLLRQLAGIAVSQYLKK